MICDRKRSFFCLGNVAVVKQESVATGTCVCGFPARHRCHRTMVICVQFRRGIEIYLAVASPVQVIERDILLMQDEIAY